MNDRFWVFVAGTLAAALDQNTPFADEALNGRYRQNQPIAQRDAAWQQRAPIDAIPDIRSLI